MERAIASNPGPTPPSHALNMTAQRNNDTGALWRCANGHREMINAAVTDKTAIPWPPITGGLDHRRGLNLDITSAPAMRDSAPCDRNRNFRECRSPNMSGIGNP